MPIYEYKCDSCNKQFEVVQKFSDSPLSQCECGSPLRKLISNTSFVLKGTGWYKTDYASKGQTKTTETEKTEKAAESEPKKDDSKKNETASDSSASAA